MDGGLIEYELRSLPGVVAAGVDADDVTLLVLPDVDADAVRVVVSALLAAHGFDRNIRVLGGMVSPAVSARTRRRVAIGAVGAVSGVGLLAGAAGVAALAGALPGSSEPTPEAAAPAVATSLPAPAAPHRADSGITVQPGEQPEWAANEGAWPLPAVLPAASVVVPPPVMPAIVVTPPTDTSSELQPIVPPVENPPVEKQPAVLTGTGPTLPAVHDPVPSTTTSVPATDDGPSGSDDDGDGHGHGRSGDRRHFGWTNGPAHASDRSSAADAPRGGRR